MLSEKASKSILNTIGIGKKQLEIFVKEQLIEGTLSYYDTIKKYPCTVSTREQFGYPRKFWRFLISHEDRIYPVLLTEYRKLQKCAAKSDFQNCLDELVSPHFEQSASHTLLLWIYTSQDCQLPKKIVTLTRNIERTDFAFNTYQRASKHKKVQV